MPIIEGALQPHRLSAAARDVRIPGLSVDSGNLKAAVEFSEPRATGSGIVSVDIYSPAQ
jgi:hypothetical protein